MRNKRAKQLRKRFKKLQAPAEWVSYTQENIHQKMVFNPLTISFDSATVYTQMYGECRKSLYKYAKENYKLKKRGMQLRSM